MSLRAVDSTDLPKPQLGQAQQTKHNLERAQNLLNTASYWYKRAQEEEMQKHVDEMKADEGEKKARQILKDYEDLCKSTEALEKQIARLGWFFSWYGSARWFEETRNNYIAVHANFLDMVKVSERTGISRGEELRAIAAEAALFAGNMG